MEQVIDYSGQLQDIIELLTSDNELLQSSVTLLEQERDCLLETINGLSMVVNFQYGLLGFLILVVVAWILKSVLFKWFFKGC